jgi:hypothetical protein
MTDVLANLGEQFGCVSTAESGWGAGGWGKTPWGGDPDEAPFLCLVYALAIRENVVRLFFSESIYWTQHGDPDDGSGIEHYIVAAEGGTGIDALPVRPDSAIAVELVAGSGNTQVDVTVDRPFSPFGTTYRATVNGLRSATGKLLGVGQNSFVFDGLQKGLPVPVPDLAVPTRDIANPQTRSALFDPLPDASTLTNLGLGTYKVDSQGDIAFDEGLVSYKKRVLRRLMTRKDAFVHLPGYGVGTRDTVKKLGRPAVRDALAADAEEQIKLEPETVDVRVTVESTPTGVFFYRIRARTNIGRTVNFASPVAFSPTGE